MTYLHMSRHDDVADNGLQFVVVHVAVVVKLHPFKVHAVIHAFSATLVQQTKRWIRNLGHFLQPLDQLWMLLDRINICLDVPPY